METWTTKSLAKIEKEIEKKLAISGVSKVSCDTTTHRNDKILFPLFALPTDLIISTSFFLNEKDIFHFEQCCRLFYQIVNNLSYLDQSNNFKTFLLTSKD